MNQAIQGTINRLLASVVFADFPELQVTAPFLAKQAITIAPEGQTSQQLGTLTGTVPSPEPYQMVTVTIHALRTQALGDAYKNQIETNTTIGSINVIPDATTLSPYQLENCSIVGWSGLNFDGTSPEFTIEIRGAYYINADLWAAA